MESRKSRIHVRCATTSRCLEVPPSSGVIVRVEVPNEIVSANAIGLLEALRGGDWPLAHDYLKPKRVPSHCTGRRAPPAFSRTCIYIEVR
jgi:hypothetical protein